MRTVRLPTICVLGSSLGVSTVGVLPTPLIYLPPPPFLRDTHPLPSGLLTPLVYSRAPP